VEAHIAWLHVTLAPVHATAELRQAAGLSKSGEESARVILREIWERPDTRKTLEIVDRHIEDGSLGLRARSLHAVADHGCRIVQQ
jgi:hypothetical protein